MWRGPQTTGLRRRVSGDVEADVILGCLLTLNGERIDVATAVPCTASDARTMRPGRHWRNGEVRLLYGDDLHHAHQHVRCTVRRGQEAEHRIRSRLQIDVVEVVHAFGEDPRVEDVLDILE